MSKSRQRGKVEEFACALDESFPGAHNGNACDWWENFNNATSSIFSRKTNKTASWFDFHTEEMTLASEEKRRALAAYKACPTKQNLQVLRGARSKHRTKNLIWAKFTLYKFGAKKCTPRLNQGQR